MLAFSALRIAMANGLFPKKENRGNLVSRKIFRPLGGEDTRRTKCG